MKPMDWNCEGGGNNQVDGLPAKHAATEPDISQPRRGSTGTGGRGSPLGFKAEMQTRWLGSPPWPSQAEPTQLLRILLGTVTSRVIGGSWMRGLLQHHLVASRISAGFWAEKRPAESGKELHRAEPGVGGCLEGETGMGFICAKQDGEGERVSSQLYGILTI